jgi:dolichol-phosphate mannosyltransferase
MTKNETNTNHPKALIIIPTYNEAENLDPLIAQILALNSCIPLDILVIDDNSPDGTGDIADRLSQTHPNVHALHRPGKMGLGTAYVQGFAWATERGYDYIFEMDCDFSHHPRYLPTFLEKIRTSDLVIGSRYVKGGRTPDWGLMRKLISRGGNTFARLMLNLKTHDCTGGYRCYRREILEHIPWEDINLQGYGFQVSAVYYVEQMGGKVVEFPIVFEDRRVGQSKMSTKIFIEAFTYVIKMAIQRRFFRPEIPHIRSE